MEWFKQHNLEKARKDFEREHLNSSIDKNHLVKNEFGEYTNKTVEDRWFGYLLCAGITERKRSKERIVAWFKHGPYDDGEPLICVFEDPCDDVCYSPLIYSKGYYDN